MKEALVLYDGRLVPHFMVSDKTAFDPFDPEMQFFPDGRLRRFRKNKVSYMAFFVNDKESEFIGYFVEKEFWDNNRFKTSEQKITAPRAAVGTKFSTAYRIPKVTIGTTVYRSHRSVKWQNNSFSLITTTGKVVYDGTEASLDFQNAETQKKSTAIKAQLIAYGKYIINKKLSLPDRTLYPLTEAELATLEDIIFILDEILDNAPLINFLKA
ncbi:MAG: hypothetical protein AAGF77_13860, partial [Bacteroidota bacterium]